MKKKTAGSKKNSVKPTTSKKVVADNFDDGAEDFVSVGGGFNPIWCPEADGEYVTIIPSGVHKGKPMENNKGKSSESFLMDGELVSTNGIFKQQKKQVEVEKGGMVTIGISAALMENENKIGHRLTDDTGEPTNFLNAAIQASAPIRIVYQGKVKSGNNRQVKTFDILAPRSLVESLKKRK